MKRRNLIGAIGTTLLGSAMPGLVVASPRSLRIGLTPVFLDDQAAFLNHWRDYLSERSGLTIQFVQRASYREIQEQLLTGDLDLAWLCGYPYVMAEQHLRLLATPLYLGRPEYRSSLIVRNDDSSVQTLDDLAGRVFAFSDPNSFSGYLYPRYLLQQINTQPESFFRRVFFTWSHRKVVEAVAAGLADGGAVASYIWDTLARIHPELTGQTRVINRSDSYGFPPFVARAGLPEEHFTIMQKVFVGMRGDPQGARLLDSLNLDGFVEVETEQYQSIANLARLFIVGG